MGMIMGGRTFTCSMAMAQQAQDFQAATYACMPGLHLEVKGDGLIAAIVEERRKAGFRESSWMAKDAEIQLQWAGGWVAGWALARRYCYRGNCTRPSLILRADAISGANNVSRSTRLT